jgi:methylphosphotriester-DNA--protein-cysteine methyltransferase
VTYESLTPAPPLFALVECLWYWEGGSSVSVKERLMPDGEPFIIINLRDEPLRIYSSEDISQFQTYGHSLLSGPLTRPSVIDRQQEDRIFGIQFRPGGLFPFLGMPLSEVSDCVLPLETLWRGLSNELRERLLSAKSIPAMFRAAERVLLAQATRPLALHDAVRFSLRCFQENQSAGIVQQVSDRTGFSQRKFIEIFRSQAGLTPKAFCRVQRFQRVLRSVHPLTEVDWSQVALASGYYDQAHLIHDFRAFSDLTPVQYWQRRTAHMNHVSAV